MCVIKVYHLPTWKFHYDSLIAVSPQDNTEKIQLTDYQTDSLECTLFMSNPICRISRTLVFRIVTVNSVEILGKHSSSPFP